MIKPDVFKRIFVMSIIMLGWGILASLLVMALASELKLFLIGFAVLSGILFFWAISYQMFYGFGQDIFSRQILVISGIVIIWSSLVLLGDYGIDPELSLVDKMPPRLLISAGINGFLFISLWFFPIFSLKIKPGKYYLISDFGQADHDFEIDYIPLQREGDTQHPGSLISRGRRRWIRPLDTAHIIWESNRAVIVKDVLKEVPMQHGYPANFELRASFRFDPLKITDANFAFTLSGQKTIKDVDKALQNIANIRLYGVLRVFYYDIPHGQATNPQIIKRLGLEIKNALADMENSMGLFFNENSINMTRIVAATASAKQPDYYRTLDSERLQKVTYGAQQGDKISRFLLYMYLVQNPELCYQFLPDTGANLRITDIDYLLSRMNADARLEEAFMAAILNTLYQMGALSSSASASGLLLSQNPQQAYPALQAGSTGPLIEHPEFSFSCTNNGTVLISWRGLSGEMHLYLDGYDVGPFHNQQSSYDTGQASLNSIEYSWGGQRRNLGPYNCRPSGRVPNTQPQPPVQNNSPLQSSPRQFGPSSDTVETHRNVDGSYEADN